MDIFRTFRQAFRLWVRKRIGPYSLEEAEEKRLFWAKCYALVGLTAMGVCTVATFVHDVDFKFEEKGSKELNVLSSIHKGDGPVRIIKIRGFSIERDETVTVKDLEEREMQQKKLMSSENVTDKKE